jgi:hypothetical protein
MISIYTTIASFGLVLSLFMLNAAVLVDIVGISRHSAEARAYGLHMLYGAFTLALLCMLLFAWK